MNWSERELDLFKSKRQRGTKPPTPIEFHLHCMIGDTLERWCASEWRYTHIPLGEYRTPATAGRLKRMGVKAGWPDYIFCHESGKVAFLELKRRGGRVSLAQEELALFLHRAQHDYLLTDNYSDALAWLKELGIVPARIDSSIGRNVEGSQSWAAAQQESPTIE